MSDRAKVTDEESESGGVSIVTSIEHVDSESSTSYAPTPLSSQSLDPGSPEQNRENDCNASVAQIQQGVKNMLLSPVSSRFDSPTPTAGYGRPSLSSRHRRSSSRVQERHEVDQEELPASKFYQNDFQQALTQSKVLARQLADTLASANLHTDERSTIHALYNQAVDASNYSGPTNWKIGLAGDSGSGKSSLINSLLDIENFARSGASGAACTCAVTEYHFHSSSEFVINVFYFPKEKMMGQFKELLQKYRRFYLDRYCAVEGSEEDNNRNEREEKKNKERKAAANSAWKILRGAFTDQDLPTEDTLIQEDEHIILGKMERWIENSVPQAYSQVGNTSNTHRECFVDERACSERLMNLTSISCATLYPYVERVEVYLNANILSRGLIIVDLPGLHDTDSTRKLICESYLVHCNEVFVIARIGRAITDAGVRDVIEFAKSTRRKHVGVVCTRSEETQPKEAVRDLHGPEAERMEVLRCTVEQLELDLAEAEHELELEYDSGIWEDRKRLKSDLERKELELETYMINTRNDRVVKNLCEGYNDYNLTRENIFCVSNHLYWKKRRDEKVSALPWLKLSGIISLRSHCLGLVGDRQLRAATSFMNENIPSLLSSMNLWIQSSSEPMAREFRAQIRQSCHEVECHLQQDLWDVLSPNNQLFTDLNHEFQRWVRTQFNTEAEESWMMGASEAADDWCRSNWGTYAAHCRNWGDHTTTTSKIHRCWNEEIVKPMIHDLEAPWNRHVIEMKAFLETRRDGLEECFEKAMRSIIALKNDVPFDSEGFSSVQTLITTLLKRKAMLCTETLDIMNEFQKEVVELGNTSLLSGVRTSFIGKYMESTYVAAAKDSRSGLYERLKELINGKVKKNPDLFNSIRLKLEDRYRELTLGAETKIQASNEKHFRAIRTALDILRTKNAAVEGERNSTFRDRMRKQVVDAQPILRKIEECIAK